MIKKIINKGYLECTEIFKIAVKYIFYYKKHYCRINL